MKLIAHFKALYFMPIFIILIVNCGPGIKPYTPTYHPLQTHNQKVLLKVQQTLDGFVNDEKIPGLQLSLKLADSAVRQIQSGTLTFDRKTRIQATDIFRIGSITKVFTAFLILKAAEDGELALTDPVSKWYPEIANSDSLTLVELLNHTSGLREILESFPVKMKSIFSHKNWKPTELIDVISNQKPYFAPKADFHYSNSNYIILGCILEKVSNKPFHKILDEKLLLPLNLNATLFLPDVIPENLISGFDRDLLPWPGLYENKVVNTVWASLAFASGAMAANALDLNVFIHNLFNGDILTEDSIKKMTTFIPIDKKEHAYWTGYGLGITRFNINGVEYWGHEGMFIGFESLLLYAPEKQESIALIGNVSSYNRFKIIQRIQEILAN